MSLVRRMSRRLSGKEKKVKEPMKEMPIHEELPLMMKPKPDPITRQVTSANLFQPVSTTSAQATDMDRTLYEIPQPDKVDAMTDLIKDHGDGFFPYVGVVGSEGESSDARRARMLAIKPSYNKRDIPEIKVLGCPLISKEGDFTMATLMKYAEQNNQPIPASEGIQPRTSKTVSYTIDKAFVHIKQITILFTPNVSSTSNYCKLWMNLVDNRLIDAERGSQTNAVVSNQEGILEMSCDYCVSANDLNCFSLSYTLERDIVHPGFQWGTASFYFNITESDLPYQSSKVDAMAVYRMPITTLMNRDTNADKSDITFTPADLVQLRKLYEEGQIVDVDQPQVARLKTNTYSKSSIRAKPKGEKLNVPTDPEWGFMKGAVKPKIDAMEASVDAESVDEPEHDAEEISRVRKEQLKRYEAEQERYRSGMRESEEKEVLAKVASVESEEEAELKEFFSKPKAKKSVAFGAGGV